MADENKVDTADSKLDPVREIVSDRTEFFINELAAIDARQDVRYNSLARRMAALEARKHGAGDIDFDKLLGTMFLVVGVLQLIPLVFELVQQWRSSSSSQLSA
jgi:hypothetical protein